MAIGLQSGKEAIIAHAHEAGLKVRAVISEPHFCQGGEFDLLRQHLAVDEHAVAIENDGLCHRHVLNLQAERRWQKMQYCSGQHKSEPDRPAEGSPQDRIKPDIERLEAARLSR